MRTKAAAYWVQLHTGLNMSESEVPEDGAEAASDLQQGLKRERREAAIADKEQKKQKAMDAGAAAAVAAAE